MRGAALLAGALAACVAVPDIAQPPSSEGADALGGASATAGDGNRPAPFGAGGSVGSGAGGAQDAPVTEVALAISGLFIEDPPNPDPAFSMTVTAKGQRTPQTVTGSATAFSLALDPPLARNEALELVITSPRGQSCRPAQASFPASQLDEGVQIFCQVALLFDDSSAADGVAGQASFTTRAQGTSMELLQGPMGAVSAAAGGNYFFVADRVNSRLVGYFAGALSGPLPAEANWVVGQPPGGARGSANPGVFNLPSDIAGDDGAILVADTSNNRVPFYYARVPSGSDSPYSTPVSLVSRDGPLTANSSSGCDRQSLNGPQGVALAGAGFAVADTGNHRVMIWSQRPTATTVPPPSVVLGQSSFFTCDIWPFSGPNALSGPVGVHWDGNNFYVVDQGAHRVLVWRGMPTHNQQSADIVLGQRDLSGRGAGSDATSLNSPMSVVVDSQHVFVADTGNHRVVGYSLAALASGMAADVCLGQPTLNNASSPNRGAPSPVANGFDTPTGVALVGARLAVTDTNNHRILLYHSQP